MMQPNIGLQNPLLPQQPQQQLDPNQQLGPQEQEPMQPDPR